MVSLYNPSQTVKFHHPTVGAHLGAKMGQVRAKMALSCPTWCQDGPKMAILDLKMNKLKPCREVSCLLFGILGAKGQIAKNIEKHVGFKVFGVLGVLLEAMLAHLGAMLGYVGPAGRHLGATWRQDEEQERQDSARWRTRTPRRGKIAEFRRPELSQGGGGFATSPLHPPKKAFSG